MGDLRVVHKLEFRFIPGPEDSTAEAFRARSRWALGVGRLGSFTRLTEPLPPVDHYRTYRL